eukprot:1160492-Pelagomonas_calceolata.AAC.2
MSSACPYRVPIRQARWKYVRIYEVIGPWALEESAASAFPGMTSRRSTMAGKTGMHEVVGSQQS